VIAYLAFKDQAGGTLTEPTGSSWASTCSLSSWAPGYLSSLGSKAV